MKKSIIVDIERMKYPNTGLHNYCKNLMTYLSKTKDFDFTFFAYKKVPLPSHIKRVNRKIIDKIFLRSNPRHQLWHGTHQTTKFVPSGTIKFVLTIHDLNFLHENKNEKKQQKLLKQIQDRIDRADYVTAISEFALNDAKTHLNLKNKKSKVIYNGVNLVKYPDFNSPSYLPKTDFFFTVGTVLPKKNFHTLVKILNQFPNHELLIGGIQPSESYLKKIINEAEKYGVESRLKLLNAVSEEEKYWYMNNCQAFLFPSLAEGFGLPVIEAMQLGKPVFLSTYTSLPEIGGKHAYYFTDFEEENMAKTLVDGLEDYEKNNKKEQIIAWTNKFTWEKSAQAYNEVYKEVLS